MTYQTSEFSGDAIHTINCTGDACVGDRVSFERATFSGGYRNASFAGFERIEAEIIKESYGAAKQQHTFTLRKDDGSILRIKGRNLYANGLYRKPWIDEAQRRVVLDEKHIRGGAARAARAERKEQWV